MTGGINQNDKRFRPNMGYSNRPWTKSWGRAGLAVGVSLGLVIALFHYFVVGAPELTNAAHWTVNVSALTLGYCLMLVPASMFAIYAISSDHLNNLKARPKRAEGATEEKGR